MDTSDLLNTGISLDTYRIVTGLKVENEELQRNLEKALNENGELKTRIGLKNMSLQQYRKEVAGLQRCKICSKYTSCKQSALKYGCTLFILEE